MAYHSVDTIIGKNLKMTNGDLLLIKIKSIHFTYSITNRFRINCNN